MTLFWKTIHLGTCKICRNSQLKISVIFKKKFFSYSNKATIKPSCCEISHPVEKIDRDLYYYLLFNEAGLQLLFQRLLIINYCINTVCSLI